MTGSRLARRIAWLSWARWLAFPGVPLLAWLLGRKAPLLASGVVLGLVLLVALAAWQQALRRQFIRESSLPRHLAQALRERFPALGMHGPDLVLRGLRQFFLAQSRARPRRAGCPSLLVAQAWTLLERQRPAYQRWCAVALGRVVEPAAAYALGLDAVENDALRRTWYWACKEESIDPRAPSRLPLLFALDHKYGVEQGFAYLPRRGAARKDSEDAEVEFYFGEDFGDATACDAGDAGGFGGSESSGGDGGGDGGGGDGGGGGD